MSYEEPYAEIEYKKMCARVAALEAALKPFADFTIPKRVRDGECIYAYFPARHFRTASATLERT